MNYIIEHPAIKRKQTHKLAFDLHIGAKHQTMTFPELMLLDTKTKFVGDIFDFTSSPSNDYHTLEARFHIFRRKYKRYSNGNHECNNGTFLPYNLKLDHNIRAEHLDFITWSRKKVVKWHSKDSSVGCSTFKYHLIGAVEKLRTCYRKLVKYRFSKKALARVDASMGAFNMILVGGHTHTYSFGITKQDKLVVSFPRGIHNVTFIPSPEIKTYERK